MALDFRNAARGFDGTFEFNCIMHCRLSASGQLRTSPDVHHCEAERVIEVRGSIINNIQIEIKEYCSVDNMSTYLNSNE